jgi:cbb3-type cytochrome oxidase maturation protein
MSSSLLLLLPISLLAVIAIGVAFWWAIFAGQFDNTSQAAESILLDDDTPPPRCGGATPDAPSTGTSRPQK